MSCFAAIDWNDDFAMLKGIVNWVGRTVHLKRIATTNTGRDDIKTRKLVATPLTHSTPACR
ncbi:hypothetical protein [Novipirellula maiorica]|uniref:hypothetical protein n=1 Tax=Novipirellula maiorica TaxID=1265734 RepID=UPI0011818046|nr:hypothetical protein [Rhodopirellula maiorica]